MLSGLQSEDVLYEEAEVKITGALVRFKNQTYPVAAINSVTFGKKPKYFFPAWICLALGAFAFGISMGDSPGAAIFFLSLGAAWAMMMFLLPSRYLVVLSTSSGEVRAMETKHEHIARGVINAIESALVSR